MLQEETAAKGSLTIKGKYGPTVEFQASGEASWGRKSQETERAASEFSREVTQKASEKVTERVLRRETLRINRQVEETNLHTFDNSVTPTGHISGVYQFVSKVYEAQVFNYGPRTSTTSCCPSPARSCSKPFAAAARPRSSWRSRPTSRSSPPTSKRRTIRRTSPFTAPPT